MTDKVQKIKECMFTKDYYTDEDRKSLCDGCKEDCRFNKKEESVNNGIDLGCGVIWRDEEPVSEDLEEAAKLHVIETRGEGVVWDENARCAMLDFKAGVNWHKQQMMKDAVDGLVVCNNLTHGFKDIVMEIPSFLNVGEKVKVIILKEN